MHDLDRAVRADRDGEPSPSSAAFAADVTSNHGEAVLRLSGELDLSKADVAHAGLREALSSSPTGRVLIDIQELTFIDSTGIGFLVLAIKDHGSRIDIRQSDAPGVRRVLDLVGMPDLVRGLGASIDGR